MFYTAHRPVTGWVDAQGSAHTHYPLLENRSAMYWAGLRGGCAPCELGTTETEQAEIPGYVTESKLKKKLWLWGSISLASGIALGAVGYAMMKKSR